MAKKSMMKITKKWMPMCYLAVGVVLAVGLVMFFGKGYMEGYATNQSITTKPNNGSKKDNKDKDNKEKDNKNRDNKDRDNKDRDNNEIDKKINDIIENNKKKVEKDIEEVIKRKDRNIKQYEGKQREGK